MIPIAFFLLSAKSIAGRKSSSSVTTIVQPHQRAAAIFYPISQPLVFASMPKRNSSNAAKSTKKPKKDQSPPSPPENDVEKWYTEFMKKDPLYADYLTNEWGFEKRGEQELFENLSLEGAQCGLSWRTILRKREAYRQAYHGFDIDKVASMTTIDVDEILSQTSKDTTKVVVRNRGKVESVIHNAKLIQELKSSGTIPSLSEFLWSFVDNKPILNRFQTFSEMPSKTEESELMSKALKKHGFKYVGPTTMYAMMQSCGFVVDHLVGSKQWADAEERLKNRVGGYQIR
jgi:DNA-3-methyladenine glycosylase I